MPLPFSPGRDPSKGPATPDPFLEFNTELDRAGVRMREAAKTQRRSPVSPPFAFALGVAGVVMAAVAFYQLAQVLATRQGPATSAILGSLASGFTAPAPSPAADTNAKTPSPAASTASPARSDVARGAAAPIVSSPAPAGPPGWMVLDARIELQIFEGKTRIGSSKNSRIELAPGSHSLTLVNTDCEIRQPIAVAITSNRTTQLPITLPSGSISVSALPWAQAWIDGVPVGTTPLANLSVPVGVHEVVWQHPTLGERRLSITVKAKTPARIGVDYTK